MTLWLGFPLFNFCLHPKVRPHAYYCSDYICIFFDKHHFIWCMMLYHCHGLFWSKPAWTVGKNTSKEVKILSFNCDKIHWFVKWTQCCIKELVLVEESRVHVDAFLLNLSNIKSLVYSILSSLSFSTIEIHTSKPLTSAYLNNP